jgi:hypothetical protein
MSLTYGEAKKILARYVGVGGQCLDSPDLDLFCKKVFQQILWTGSHGSIRKYCFCAVKGCITLPYELETPLKVRVDNGVGTVWNKFYEFYNVHDMERCTPAADALYEEPNTFCTVYDLPNSSCRVGVLGTAEEADSAHLIVSGTDASGREVFTNHQGVKVSGEYLRIEKGQLRYSQVAFANITSIKKSITNGYVQLLWYRPELGIKGFLSDYTPYEEVPEYRRFRLTGRCQSPSKVSVLGRIRLKDRYGDNERIPFDNILAIELAGQAANSGFNNDEQMSVAKEQHMTQSILKEATYKVSNTGQPMEIMTMLSGAAIKNIVY